MEVSEELLKSSAEVVSPYRLTGFLDFFVFTFDRAKNSAEEAFGSLRPEPRVADGRRQSQPGQRCVVDFAVRSVRQEDLR